jgi:NhaA family Na+:H+ antiporter
LTELAVVVGGTGGGRITLHFLVNDVLMAFFFALAGKEIWESMLPGGALGSVRTAALPIFCAAAGMAGPAAVYLLGAALLGQLPALGRGWAVPCATDVALSYLVARAVLPPKHAAIAFLLLLAIADDAGGLIVLAVFYPQGPVHPSWLLLAAAAVVLGILLRRGRVNNFWWFILGPGAMSWASFALAGLHPALGLLPIIPTLPHIVPEGGGTGAGGAQRLAALHHFHAWWGRPVEIILGLFGLFNAGVVLSSFGPTSYLVLGGLLVGKPLGIALGGLLAVRLLGLRLPPGVTWRELWVVGCAAGIGFTVSLFVATVAFGEGSPRDAAKMGALASCLAAATALVAGRILQVKKAG